VTYRKNPRFGNNGAKAMHQKSQKKYNVLYPYIENIMKRKREDEYVHNIAKELCDLIDKKQVIGWRDSWSKSSVRSVTNYINKYIKIAGAKTI
jgi:hypothetical protein